MAYQDGRTPINQPIVLGTIADLKYVLLTPAEIASLADGKHYAAADGRGMLKINGTEETYALVSDLADFLTQTQIEALTDAAKADFARELATKLSGISIDGNVQTLADIPNATNAQIAQFNRDVFEAMGTYVSDVETGAQAALDAAIAALKDGVVPAGDTLKKLYDLIQSNITEIQANDTDIADIQTLLNSDDINLDSLQEIVDFIKDHEADFAALNIDSITGLREYLDGLTEVDRWMLTREHITGKQQVNSDVEIGSASAVSTTFSSLVENASDTTFTVADSSLFAVGDVVEVGDGSTTKYGTVTSIADATTMVVDVLGLVGTGSIVRAKANKDLNVTGDLAFGTVSTAKQTLDGDETDQVPSVAAVKARFDELDTIDTQLQSLESRFISHADQVDKRTNVIVDVSKQYLFGSAIVSTNYETYNADPADAYGGLFYFNVDLADTPASYGIPTVLELAEREEGPYLWVSFGLGFQFLSKVISQNGNNIRFEMPIPAFKKEVLQTTDVFSVIDVKLATAHEKSVRSIKVDGIDDHLRQDLAGNETEAAPSVAAVQLAIQDATNGIAANRVKYSVTGAGTQVGDLFEYEVEIAPDFAGQNIESIELNGSNFNTAVTWDENRWSFKLIMPFALGSSVVDFYVNLVDDSSHSPTN